MVFVIVTLMMAGLLILGTTGIGWGSITFVLNHLFDLE